MFLYFVLDAGQSSKRGSRVGVSKVSHHRAYRRSGRLTAI